MINKSKQERNLLRSSLFILAILMSSCSSPSTDIDNAPLLSDNWEILQSNAHSWKTDAYPTDINFHSSGESPYKIVAEYHSDSAPNKILFVGMDHIGRMVVTPYDSPPLASSGAQKPISRQDWVIDTQQAMTIFSKNEAISSCLKSPKAIIQLSLNKVYTDVAAWVLDVVACPNKNDFHWYLLDAMTGEIIDPFI